MHLFGATGKEYQAKNNDDWEFIKIQGDISSLFYIMDKRGTNTTET
jgi:hypothetical protein